MEIQSQLSSSIGAPSTGGDSPLTRAGQTLGRDEFMRLLTVQLTHQDPLEPITNEAFISQLAEFSALEQMQGINESLQTSQLLDQSINNFLASNLIGREVRVSGDVLQLPAGAGADFFIGLQAPADATVSIQSADGQLVRRLEIGRLGSGENRIVWDGRGEDGEQLPPGRYSLSIDAVDDAGSPVVAATATVGEVDALRFRDGQALLVVQGRELPLAEVFEIRDGRTDVDN